VRKEFASDLMSDLVKVFNEDNVRYAVLRNYKALPQANVGKDVDIFVHEKDLKTAINLALEVAERNKYILVWKNCLDYLLGLIFVKFTSGCIYSLKLDFFPGFRWRGIVYFPSEVFSNYLERYRDFWIPNCTVKSLQMILYYVLYAKRIKQKYYSEIFEGYFNNKSLFKEVSIEILGEICASNLMKALELKDVNKILALREQIVRSLMIGNLRVRKFGFFFDFLRHLYVEYIMRFSMGVLIFSDAKTPLEEVLCKLGVAERLQYNSCDILHYFTIWKKKRKNQILFVERKCSLIKSFLLVKGERDLALKLNQHYGAKNESCAFLFRKS